MDPHEEKWNHLAIMGVNNDKKYTAQDIDSKINDYISSSKTANATTYSFQNQAFKELTKQNEFMKIFNQKLMKQLEDTQRAKTLGGFGSNGSNYLPPQSNFIINPEQISPLIKASEDRIAALEEEMYLREKEMVKMTGIIDLLIEENKYLRDHIAFKNKDIARVLETIGLNDGESIHDLRHRMNLLTEENNLLLTHLEDLKGVKENFDKFNKDKYMEIERMRELYENTKRGLEDALRREEGLTNFKQMIEPKYTQAQQKISEYEARIEEMMNEINQLKNTNMLLSNQVQYYKKTLEDTDGKKTLEIDKLIQEMNILQNEKKELKKNLEIKDKNIDVINDETRKNRKEIEHLKLEYEEAVQVMNDLKNQLANERQRADIAAKKEKEFREKADKFAIEVEKVNVKLQGADTLHNKTIDTLHAEYEAKINKLQANYESLKNSKSQILAEKDDEIESLTKQINDMKRNLDRIRDDKNQLNNQLNTMRSNEMVELSEKDKIISELEHEIERLNQNFIEAENAAKEDLKKLQMQNEDLRKESMKLNDTNKQLTLKINNMKTKQSVTNTRSVETISKEQDHIIELNKELSILRDENSRLRSQIDTLKNIEINEIQKENIYLHDVVKSMTKDDDTKIIYDNNRSPINDNTLSQQSQPKNSANYNSMITRAYQGILPFKQTSSTIDNIQKSIKNDGNSYNGYESSSLAAGGYTKSLTGNSPNKNGEISNSMNNIVDVDSVVDKILKKYNLTSLPDPNEIPQKLMNGYNIVNTEFKDSKSPFTSKVIVDKSSGSPPKYIISNDPSALKTSNLHYLSPLLSSERKEIVYDMKYASDEPY